MLRTDKKRKSRGWVPFGYKYLGPGNDLYRGPPTTSGDKAAQKHDWKYFEFEKAHKRNPKYVYTEADDEFIKEVGSKHTSEWIAEHIFKGKKRLAESGWIEDYRPRQRAKRETTPNNWQQFITPDRVKRKQEGITPIKEKKARRELFDTTIISQNPRNSNNNDNMPEQAKSGSGNEHGLTETKIDKVNPYKVFRGPPNYTFASLPFQYDAVINDDQVFSRDIVFRMTSPYDPLNTITSQDINTGAGQMLLRVPVPDASDVTQRKANWYDYYAGLYKYYHTIACEYTVFIENYGEPIWVYFMYMNDELPNPLASNQDMQLWQDCEYHYVQAPAYGHEVGGVRIQGVISRGDNTDTPMENVENATPSGDNPADVQEFQSTNMVVTRTGQCTLEKYGKYSPGDYDNEIRLDADIENWTAINANPKLPEKMVIRVKPQSNVIEANSGRNAGGDCRYRIRVQINYLTEFKELDSKIRYPVVTQPITVTLSDVQTGRS